MKAKQNIKKENINEYLQSCKRIHSIHFQIKFYFKRKQRTNGNAQVLYYQTLNNFSFSLFESKLNQYIYKMCEKFIIVFDIKTTIFDIH